MVVSHAPIGQRSATVTRSAARTRRRPAMLRLASFPDLITLYNPEVVYVVVSRGAPRVVAGGLALYESNNVAADLDVPSRASLLRDANGAGDVGL